MSFVMRTTLMASAPAPSSRARLPDAAMSRISRHRQPTQRRDWWSPSASASRLRESASQRVDLAGHPAGAHRRWDSRTAARCSHQISDGEMNNTPNTDQRGFANAGNTYRIEDDVVLDASTQTATADYPQLRDAAKKQFASVTSRRRRPASAARRTSSSARHPTGYSQVGRRVSGGRCHRGACSWSTPRRRSIRRSPPRSRAPRIRRSSRAAT